MLDFCRRHGAKNEAAYLRAALEGGLPPDGPFCARAAAALGALTGAPGVLLTPSGTSALEVGLLALDLGPGDEVVLPSFNFPSAANAVLLTGATPVFCDIEPGTQNLSVKSLFNCLTPRTRAVVAVHYAGVACEMGPLLKAVEENGLSLVEDAAHAVGASWQGRALGTLGRLGAYSFHASKNLSCGEGGALLCRGADLPAAESCRDKGTDRARWQRGESGGYAWVHRGTSGVLAEPLAAILLAQLEEIEEITARRLALCAAYAQALAPLERAGALRRMAVPAGASPNGHIFYVRFENAALCARVQRHLLRHGVDARTHYFPLHLSPMGRRLGYAPGQLPESERAYQTLLRLPLYPALEAGEAQRVCALIGQAVRGT